MKQKADGTATVTASLSCGAQNLTADTLVTLTECDGGYIPVPTICGIGACASHGDNILCRRCYRGLLHTWLPPAADDATCDCVDDDCSGSADEDYPTDVSCFLPGACAAANQGSTCVAGTETLCQTGTPAADDATCDSVDDDCSGSADEDYPTDVSCFLPGAWCSI